MGDQPNKIICSMIRVSKYYDKKPILKDISLSYFYGAKIGVLGLNGSGKTSLLRIMAGKDTEFNGELILSSGHTVGYLEQEPVLDDTKSVKEIVEEAGMGISHVYEDLVFLDHNAILLQFTEDSGTVLLRINREADQETAAAGAALLKQAALAREMQFLDSGSYALAQDGPEQVRIEFFP